MTRMTRREMIAVSVAGVPLAGVALSACHAQEAPGEPKAVGPLLGHVDHETAMIWYRPVKEGRYVAQITEAGSDAKRELAAVAKADNDLCVSWRFDKLKAGTEYRYRILQNGQAVVDDEIHRIRTAPSPGAASRTALVLGSCASSTKFFEIWERIHNLKPDGMVLLGDTPYIDTVNVKVNRDKHRQFLAMPTLARMGADTPIWGTWDDHDFGANDSDGRIKGKEGIRKVFTEYRTHTSYGDGKEGIYTRFRRGPVEVFMLDPRYFAQTEPSPVDPDKPSCLGKTQWNWLLRNLKASTATFKILASGMIWDDKKNREKDDWHTYEHEREALFDFIGKNKIGGVILIGGDIHVCRHLHYPTQQRIGYDLHQFIISPLHDSVIRSLNVPHPNLLWGEPLPNMFLHMVCDGTASPPTLTAKWIDITGKVHREVKLTATDLATT